MVKQLERRDATRCVGAKGCGKNVDVGAVKFSFIMPGTCQLVCQAHSRTIFHYNITGIKCKPLDANVAHNPPPTAMP